MVCYHPRREFGRVIARNGAVHVMERCAECQVNVRGPGRWVARTDLRQPAESLPVFEDRRPGPDAPRQQEFSF